MHVCSSLSVTSLVLVTGFLFFFNFIDFCLCSAFLAALGAFSSRGAGLITAVVSLVAVHGL